MQLPDTEAARLTERIMNNITDNLKPKSADYINHYNQCFRKIYDILSANPALNVKAPLLNENLMKIIRNRTS